MTRRLVGLHITRALGFLVAPLAASAQQSPESLFGRVPQRPRSPSLALRAGVPAWSSEFGDVVCQPRAIEERAASK